jgi:hypothetical protein
MLGLHFAALCAVGRAARTIAIVRNLHSIIAALAAFAAFASARGASATVPSVAAESCSALDRAEVDDIVRLELSGLDFEVDAIALECPGSDAVSVRVSMREQALIRELDLAGQPSGDRNRFVSLNIVEMVELLDGRTRKPAPVVEPVVASGLVRLPPASSPPERPWRVDHAMGAYALGQYHLGFDAPFGGVAAGWEMRAPGRFGLRVDLQLGFRNVELEAAESPARLTTLGLGSQLQWWVNRWVAVGPGFRLGTVVAGRDDLGTREVAFWGGLTAGTGVYFPLFERTRGVFGLEVGYSPWTYRVVAQDREAVRMQGLFSSAYFGAQWGP